jgi:hypothetical protein
MNKFPSSYLDRKSRNQKTETYLKQKKVLSENKDTREHVFTLYVMHMVTCHTTGTQLTDYWSSKEIMMGWAR